jgi:hypothetical protein
MKSSNRTGRRVAPLLVVTLALCATTARGDTIAGPSWLHVNLSYLSFGNYYDDINHIAASFGFTRSCPAGSTVEGCIRDVLANMRAQGVSGVRIFVPLCEGNPSISPLTNCGQAWTSVYFDGNSGPGHTWLVNAGKFFQDMSDAHIQNVAITFVLGGPIKSVAKSEVYSPLGGPSHPGQDLCTDTPDPVFFQAGLPFGLKPVGNGYYPVGQGEMDSQ